MVEGVKHGVCRVQWDGQRARLHRGEHGRRPAGVPGVPRNRGWQVKRSRCVFTVRSVERVQGGYDHSQTPPVPVEANVIKASAIMAGESNGIPDAERFHQATPSGQLEFRCDNPALVGSFAPGDTFYLDMIPVVKS